MYTLFLHKTTTLSYPASTPQSPLTFFSRFCLGFNKNFSTITVLRTGSGNTRDLWLGLELRLLLPKCRAVGPWGHAIAEPWGYLEPWGHPEPCVTPETCDHAPGAMRPSGAKSKHGKKFKFCEPGPGAEFRFGISKAAEPERTKKVESPQLSTRLFMRICMQVGEPGKRDFVKLS